MRLDDGVRVVLVEEVPVPERLVPDRLVRRLEQLLEGRGARQDVVHREEAVGDEPLGAVRCKSRDGFTSPMNE